ncbi:hypothetical protein ACMGE7_06320 [Macrococcus equi]|uniref:hypothetical protein n=1 Tax=Macrococcus equi TaxID=3395462 RepID=UPI0039BE9DEF
MKFYDIFIHDVSRLQQRYPYFEMIEVNHEILKAIAQLEIDDQTKCAILAIDTSMRMQDLINDKNKDKFVLSTDLLSALFYHYLASPFHQHHFKVLTNSVAKQNELKQEYALTKDEKLVQQINDIFLLPFMTSNYINESGA